MFAPIRIAPIRHYCPRSIGAHAFEIVPSCVSLLTAIAYDLDVMELHAVRVGGVEVPVASQAIWHDGSWRALEPTEFSATNRPVLELTLRRVSHVGLVTAVAMCPVNASFSTVDMRTKHG